MAKMSLGGVLMTEEEIIKLNTQRLKVQLGPILKQFDKKLIPYYKKIKFKKQGGKIVTLDEIDFNESCIFISKEDIMPFVSMFALQKVSGVRSPDTTKSGNFSRIRKDYLLAESNETRYAGKAGLDIEEVSDIPDIYKPELFYTKELVIWRLGTTVASKYTEYMYDFCCSRVYERKLRRMVDWCFFIGSYDQFHNTYIGMPESVPVYMAVIPRGKKKITVEESDMK